MTASTPRITEQQARARFSDCNGNCNQGRQCTCREPADMGCSLGINEALQRRREALTPAAWLFLWPLAVLIAIASAAAVAFFYDYVLSAYF